MESGGNLLRQSGLVPEKPLPSVRLHRAAAADVPAITALIRDAYAVYVPRIGREPMPMTLDYSDVVATRATWLARVDDELVGVLVLEPHEDHLLLENVAVAPGAQRTGVGDRLMRFAEERPGRSASPRSGSTRTRPWWRTSPTTRAAATGRRTEPWRTDSTASSSPSGCSRG